MEEIPEGDGAMDLVLQPFDWLPFGSGEKRQATPRIWCVKCTCRLHLPMTPVWMESCVLEVRHRAIFLGWCGGVMDSARDFDLLGESVPQVRVSARPLALRGFFNM